MVTALVVWLLVSLGPLPQQPAIQNGQLETRQNTSIERAVADVTAASDPVWIAWRAPMVAGDRDLCAAWSTGATFSRGVVLEGASFESGPPVFKAPGGPVRLEAGTALVVLLRIAGGEVERVRVVTDDCSIDAGGRRIVWLPSVTASASVQYLDSLTAAPALSTDSHRRRASTAVTAIALHDDNAADRALERLLSVTVDAGGDTSLRNAAASWTARSRGRRGFEYLVARIGSERDPAFRRTLTSALAETREAETLQTLLSLARSDADEHVRAEALSGFARLAPAADVSQIRAVMLGDASATVKRRAVNGLSRRPDSVALLIDLARSSDDRVVRTEAVRALSRSTDPTAIAYLTSVLTP